MIIIIIYNNMFTIFRDIIAIYKMYFLNKSMFSNTFGTFLLHITANIKQSNNLLPYSVLLLVAAANSWCCV